jgi:hypothetical protein
MYYRLEGFQLVLKTQVWTLNSYTFLFINFETSAMNYIDFGVTNQINPVIITP